MQEQVTAWLRETVGYDNTDVLVTEENWEWADKSRTHVWHVHIVVTPKIYSGTSYNSVHAAAESALNKWRKDNEQAD